MKLPRNHIHIVAFLAVTALAACQPKPASAPDTTPAQQQHQPPTQNINREIIIVVPPGDHAAARQHREDRP